MFTKPILINCDITRFEPYPGIAEKDVIAVLTDSYGNDVKVGEKAIAIAARGNRRKVDVIACIQFRRYFKFMNAFDQSYEEGICFYNSKGDKIANYPKQHSKNLTHKHQSSDKRLKPMVRILKNMCVRMIEDGYFGDGIAPSYFLEGLLYNVPNDKYVYSLQDCFINAINWIQHEADKEKLLCANEQYYLLRDNSNVCWPKKNGEAFLNGVIDFWNNW